MSDKPHPHRVILSAEMKRADIIDQTVILEGCNGFLEIALFNIFLTIYERDSDLFFRVMDRFIEEELKNNPFGNGDNEDGT